MPDTQLKSALEFDGNPDLIRPMIYRTYRPQPPLSEFVDLFWFDEGYAPPHAKERLLPSGTMEMVINLREDRLQVYDRHDVNKFQRFEGSLICGAHSEFFVIDTKGQTATIGVHFKPGGAFPFLKVAADELRNAHVSLETMWGAAASRLIVYSSVTKA